jgi:RHS repeat-associated protein
MATRPSLASIDPSKLYRVFALGIALAGAFGPACSDSHRSDEAVAPIARALAEPNWTPGVTYQVGDLVQYNGIVYECRQTHTAAVGWEPPKVITLWQRPTPIELKPWEIQVHYIVGSDVSYNGSLWECLQEHVSQIDWAPGSVTTLWRKAGSGASACTGLSDGSLCDDGKPCNVDTCQAGVCVGSARTCGGSILPTTDDSGTLPGHVEVTQAGKAIYTIALWAPEGRNGMSPSLSLSYSSTRGDGVLGIGWTITGGSSMITRCVADSARDPLPSPITGASPTFCLDGQRLVLASGTAGAVNAEYRTQPDSFSRVIVNGADALGPTGFTVYSRDGRIHAYGPSPGTTDATLTIQAAVTRWSANDSTRQDQGVTPDRNTNSRQAWLRGKVADRLGNAIAFRYTNPGSITIPQEPLLSVIEYADVGSFKTRSIKFNYAPRSPAAVRKYSVAGIDFAASQILRSIEMKVARPGSQTLETIRAYQFTQSLSAATQRSRLDTVEECDGMPPFAGTRPVKCKKATTFAYEQGAETFTPIPIPSLSDARQPVDSALWAIYVGDLNRDGKTDLIYRARIGSGAATDPVHWFGRLAQSGSSPVGFSAAIDLNLQADNVQANALLGDAVVADFDGDGFADIAVPSGTNTLAYYHNEGTATDTPSFALIANGAPASSFGLQIGDFSGRGRTSILRPPVTGSSWTYSSFSRSCDIEGHCTVTQSPSSSALPVSFETDAAAGWSTFAADIDGDHAMNLLSRGGSLINHLVSIRQVAVPGVTPPSPSDWSAPVPTTLLASQQGDLVKYVFLDQNGDGLPDALRFRQGEGTPALIMNSGTGFGAPQPLSALVSAANGVGSISLGSGTNFKDIKETGVRIIDYDGDGKDDVLLVDNGAVRDSSLTTNSPKRSNLVVLLSRGTGASAFEVHPLDGAGGRPSIALGAPADGPLPPDVDKVRNYKQTQVVDVNGDGLSDVILYSSLTNTFQLQVRNGGRPDLLIGVTDGMGKKTTIDYSFVTDDAVYTVGAGCAWPQVCVWIAFDRVVSSLSVENGSGGDKNTYKYHYRDRRFDPRGGGMLGFGDWTVSDLQAHTETTETFDINTIESLTDPAGRVAQVYTKLGLPTDRVVATMVSSGSHTTVHKTSAHIDYQSVTIANGATYYARPTSTTETVDDTSDSSGFVPKVVMSSIYDDVSLDTYGVPSALVSTTTTTAGDFVDVRRMTYDKDPLGGVLAIKNQEVHCSASPTEPGTPVTANSCNTLPANAAIPKRVTTYTTDVQKGVVTAMDIQPSGGDAQHLHVTFTRSSPYGLLTKITRNDNKGASRADSIGYDAQGVHGQTLTNALNQLTTIATDPALGVVLSITNPNGVVTTTDYDGFGRVRRANSPDGGGLAISYSRDTDPPGSAGTQGPWSTRSVRQTDGGGELRVWTNRIGQEIRREVKNFDGSVSYQTKGYDALGLPKLLTRPRLVGQPIGPDTAWQHDELGRLIETDRDEEAVDGAGAPVGSTGTISDFGGLVETFTDEVGRQRRVTSDSFGRLTRSETINTSGQWVATDFTYGPFGVLRFAIRKNGTGGAANALTTEFRYDELGRRTVLIDPDAGASGLRTRSYNAFGDVIGETDAEGKTSTYVVDGLGRTKQRTDQRDGTTAFTWDTADNGIGKLASSQSPSGVKCEYLYDTAGRLYRETSTIDGIAYQIDYAFEPSTGRLAHVTYPNATGFGRLVVTNSYDPNSGRLTKVRNEATGELYWTLVTATVDGQVTKESFGSGGVSTTYAYSDATGRLKSIATSRGSAALRSWEYAYLPDGNLQRRSDLLTNQHERFEYDGSNRIKRWVDATSAGAALSGGWVVNYVFDDFGNITQRTFAPGTSTGGTAQNVTFTLAPGSDRVSSSSLSGSYSYDGNGNQTGRPNGEAVTYTAFNLPKTITGPHAATFKYDAAGRRAKKQLTTTSDSTVYVSGLYEKRVNGSVGLIDHIFYILGPDGPVAQVSRHEGGTEKVRYVHTDRLGSVDAVTDAATSSVVRTKRDPFGNAIADFNRPILAGSSSGNLGDSVRLGFTGEEQDDDLGLVNMNARIFDPLLGRFLTPDPVLFKTDGASYGRYNYALGNPLAFVDPSGMAPDGPHPADVLCYTDVCRAARACQSSPGGCLTFTDPHPQGGAGGSGGGSPACDASGACAPGATSSPGIDGADGASGNSSASRSAEDGNPGASSSPTMVAAVAGTAVTAADATAAATQAALETEEGLAWLDEYLAAGEEIVAVAVVEELPAAIVVGGAAVSALGAWGMAFLAAGSFVGGMYYLSRGYSDTGGARSRMYDGISGNPGSGGITGTLETAGTRPGDLPAKGPPNSGAYKDDGKGNGQIRYYGPDGRAEKDFDFGHDHNGSGDPHAHDWDWTKVPQRQPPRPLKPGE